MPAFRVNIQPAVIKALGFADLSRTALVRLVAKLLTELPGDVGALRHRRLPDDPDCFEYRVAIYDQDQPERPRRFLFRFAVNDTRSPDVLFLVNVRFSSKPWQPEP
ncbi:MAG: hypothetical protein JNM56_21155 [Planctomycetia bacterium]|nr:hypothetical protein [Planctomycetia bacterium]